MIFFVTERDLIGVDDKGTRLLFMGSESDFEESIIMKKSFLKKYVLFSSWQVPAKYLIYCTVFTEKRPILDHFGNNQTTQS